MYRIWSDSTGFCVLCKNVGRPIRLQKQVFVIDNSLWSWTQSWNCCWPTTWPRDIGTTEHEDHATYSRKRSINVFSSKAWHGTQFALENGTRRQLAANACKCWLRRTPACHLQIAISAVTFHTYHMYTWWVWWDPILHDCTIIATRR